MSVDPSVAAKRAKENFEAMRVIARKLAIAVRDDLPPPIPIYDEAVEMAVAGDPGRARRLNDWWKRHGGVVNLTPVWLMDRLGMLGGSVKQAAE